MAEFLVNNKKFKETETALKEANQFLPDSKKLHFALARLYELTQRPDDARAIYTKIKEDAGIKPEGLEADIKLAALDLAEGKPEMAGERIERALQENPRSAMALTLKGKLALSLNDGKTAVQTFRTLLKDQSEIAPVHAMLGSAHQMLGETDLARASFDKAVALNPAQVDAQHALVRLDLAQRKQDAARDRLEKLSEVLPKDLKTLGMLLSMYSKEQSWEKAEKILGRMREAGMPPLLSDMAEGDLYRARKAWGPAIALYEKVAAASPKSLEPLIALTRVDIQQGKGEKAMNRLRKIILQDSNHPFASGLLGELLIAQKDLKRGEMKLIEATKINPQWIAPWVDLAKLRLIQKKPSEAAVLLESGLASRPDSSDLGMLLASAYEQDNQVDKAIQVYEKLLQKNPNAMLAANNLAYLLADKKGDPASLEKALGLAQDFDKRLRNPFFLDTLGWVYIKLGQEEVALGLLKEAVEKVPGQALFEYHLALAYYKTGDKAKSKVYLAKALHTGKSFSGIADARVLLNEIETVGKE